VEEADREGLEKVGGARLEPRLLAMMNVVLTTTNDGDFQRSVSCLWFCRRTAGLEAKWEFHGWVMSEQRSGSRPRIISQRRCKRAL
jgi:hypothetical protein